MEITDFSHTDNPSALNTKLFKTTKTHDTKASKGAGETWCKIQRDATATNIVIYFMSSLSVRPSHQSRIVHVASI